MSRVDENDHLQRLEYQRIQEQKTKEEQKTAATRFAQSMGQKKVDKQSAVKVAVAHKQMGKNKEKGSAALQARSGIVTAHKFDGLLQTAGKDSVDRGKGEVKNRKEDVQEKETQRKETKAEKNLSEIQHDAARVEAIEYERNRGGGGSEMGGGNESGQEKNMQGQATVGMGQGMPQAQAPVQAQGGGAPQLPSHIIQELVKRVMVGVDKEGMATFVVQFKDDVLGGATMEVTAKNGKISAKFTTGDKNAGRLIKSSEGALARAFAQKGMSLESLTVESR